MSTAVMIVELLSLLALQVDAQFTIDDDGVCEPYKWGDMVDLIKGELKNVKTVIQQQGSTAASAFSLEEHMKQLREDFKDVKSACACNQQSVVVDSPGVLMCELLVIKSLSSLV